MTDPSLLTPILLAFERRFGRAPEVAASAPGRVNLIGEHTDYNEGFVLPMAIDRRAIALGARSAGRISRIAALDLDASLEIDLDDPGPEGEAPGWSRLLPAIARGFAERGIRVPAVDLALTSTVPVGAGLSSSAAVEVALATVLEEITGVRFAPEEKARLCREAEHRALGTPCGIMDMLVSILGRPGHALLIDCRSLEAVPVPLPAPEEALVLVADTGVRHDLASGAYAERAKTCRRAAERLGVRALRDATAELVAASGLQDAERRRARHVVTENTRTTQAAARLREGDLTGVGALLDRSHDSLRDDYAVSCPELDTIVETARALRGGGAGVLGARMTGGGFGGCAIVLCRAVAAGSVSEGLRAAFASAHDRPLPILIACAAAGAGPIALPEPP